MKIPPHLDIGYMQKIALMNQGNPAGAAALAHIAKIKRDAQKNAHRQRTPSSGGKGITIDAEFEVVQPVKAIY